MKKADVLALRTLLGATQEQFACILGSSITTISRWETGKNDPRDTDGLAGLETICSCYTDPNQLRRILLVAVAVGVPVGSWLRTDTVALMQYLVGPAIPKTVEVLFSTKKGG